MPLDPAYHDEYDVLIVEHPVTWTGNVLRLIGYRYLLSYGFP